MVQVHVGPLLSLSLPANVPGGAALPGRQGLVTDSIGKMPAGLSQMSRAREPVRSLINWILGFWALVSVAIAVWFLSINSSAGDWQDVVTIIVVVLSQRVAWRSAYRGSSFATSSRVTRLEPRSPLWYLPR